MDNAELFKRASEVIPGGVDSPVRAFGSVGGHPYFVARAEGCYVWDVEGRRYVDYVQSWGASILGHADSRIVDAVRKAAGDGTSYGAPTEREVLLAEAIRERVPSCQKVRLVNSGTEAAMSAVRLARGATGRDRVVKFAGCYHGHSDALLAAGALLIFDEVITGFRLGPGGAQERYGVAPDLSCFGKVIGGGLPLAAFGGRSDVMDLLAPEGPVYQAGTLSGNPLATAAGLAVLDALDDSAYRMLAGRAEELGAWLTDVITEAGLAVQIPVVGPLMGLFFSEAPVTDYDAAKAADGDRYARFFHQMLDRGVALPPSPFEALFPSLAHPKDELERTADLAAAAARAIA